MNTPRPEPSRIIFDLTIDLPKTRKRSEPTTGVYLGELIIVDVNEITLRVYFSDGDTTDGIMGWEGNHAFTLLSRFHVTRIHSPEHLLEVDFADYNYTGMQSSTDFVDPVLMRQYFIIKLAGIRLKYKSDAEADSRIYLNDTATKLAELYYDYSNNFPWAEKFTWAPTNRLSMMSFGKIDFILEHNFYQDGKSSAKEVAIKKEPRIRIKYNTLSSEEIAAHRDLLCALLSFYTNKRIDWTVSRIISGDGLLVERRKIPGESVEIIHGLFIWSFIQNPMNLILNVSTEKLLNKLPVVSRLIERFNYSFHASDETKFMILYSILEQVRNEYILDGLIEQDKAGNPPDLRKVKEEFTFVGSKSEVNAAIRSSLEQLVSRVHASDQQKFRDELAAKISFIKLYTMSGQFESLFSYLNMDTQKYGLDFKTLKRLRDQIFHGKLLEGEDIDYLKRVNWYSSLPTLTGIVILKYFGIADLETIPKKKLRG